MDDSSNSSRRTLRRSEAEDDLGAVPDGYTFASDAPTIGWQQPETVNPYVTPDAEKRTERAGKSAGRALREVVETILLAAIIFFGVRLLVLNFKVDGRSMTPNLINNELLLVNRNAYKEIDINDLLNKIPGVDRDGEWVIWTFDPPERGDIIVFNPPNGDTKPYIKRVIATAGETISFRDGDVYVDGIKLDEPYIDDGITQCDGDRFCGGFTVPEGQVFVLGDNRTGSSDSRAFGPVPIDDIIGKAIVTYWPADEIDLVPHYDYPEIEE